ARTAVFGPAKLSPTLARLRSDGRKNGDAKTFPAAYDLTGLSLSNAFHAVHRIPADGEYVFKVGLAGLRPAGSEAITIAFWVDDKPVGSATHDMERSARFDEDRQD